MKQPNQVNSLLTPESAEDLKSWGLPNVAKELSEEEKAATNAMGKQLNWQYEPPEEIEDLEPVPLTAEEIEEIRQAAFQEGFEQGKTEGFEVGKTEGFEVGKTEGIEVGRETGLKQGVEQGQEIIEEHRILWKSLAEQLHQPLRNLDKNTEEQLLQLTCSLVDAVVMVESKTNPEIIFAALQAGIKALPNQDSQCEILLNPDDLLMVEEHFGEDELAERRWRLVKDNQLERGSCQLENATSHIDLRLKTRLKEVLDSFLQEATHHD